jgi:hypothetical protein
MDLVITNQINKTYTTYVTINGYFNNVSSSSSQGNSLREEFVNIQSFIYQQPSSFGTDLSININQTYPAISIQY